MAEPQTILEARSLSKVYDMGEVRVEALRSVDVDLLEGELLVLLGASGSGKSTLLNILGGLDLPTAGTLRYRDRNLSRALVDRSARVVTAGTLLLEMADVRGLEVVLDVLSEDAVRIEPGQDVRITEWGGDGSLHGTVETVTLAGYTRVSALGVEEQRVDVIATLAGTPETLGTGYRVAGDIVTWRGEDVLVVPTAAVFRSEGAWTVFTVGDGRATLREIVLGPRNAERAQVLEGLEEGTEVVLFPPSALSDGAEVRVLREAP